MLFDLVYCHVDVTIRLTVQHSCHPDVHANAALAQYHQQPPVHLAACKPELYRAYLIKSQIDVSAGPGVETVQLQVLALWAVQQGSDGVEHWLFPACLHMCALARTGLNSHV